MNRRKLLGMLGLIPAATAFSKNIDTARATQEMNAQEMFSRIDEANLHVAEHLSRSNVDRFSYRGYEVMWTGWKEDQRSVDRVAQFVAYWKDGVHALYVSNPGGWGTWPRGNVFDTVWRWPQLLTADASPWQLERAKADMRYAIFRLIRYTLENRLEETDFYSGPCLQTPRLHPELPDYTGWQRFTPQQIEDIRNEVRMEAERSPDGEQRARKQWYGIKA